MLSITNSDVPMSFLPHCCRIALPGMCISASKMLDGLGVAVGGVVIGATKRGEVQSFCRWVKNIKQNMLIDTISHPHIASASRF
jgi:O-acetylhomoserine/O-acetylserine sulfhydrylase-like pyridoxal-dependent enzyme